MSLPRALLFAAVLACPVIFVLGCAEVLFIGGSRTSLRPMPQNKVTPERAMELASPHLPRAWELRCIHVHRRDQHWCAKPPQDYMVQKGDYYYVTRTSYPYKTFHAYVNYAVRVHVETAEVIPPTAPDS